MRKDDPLRLKQAQDASPTLVRALDALRKGANETSRLERVASKLGPLLDAPHNSNVAAGARHTPTALKLIMGGLALLAPALWFARSEPSPKPQVGARHNESARVANKSQEAAVALPRAEPTVSSPDTTVKPTALAPAEHTHHDNGGPARSVRALAPVRQQLAELLPAASASERTANPTPSAPEIAQAPRELEHSANAPGADARSRTVMPPTAAKADATNPVSPSEAELLFDARKAMLSNTALALQLLAEHEKRYPSGLLVPEREVLAIEALRSSGRKAEADARLLRFEARYPDSFHLERLQR
jgi:hypothetical protein